MCRLRFTCHHLLILNLPILRGSLLVSSQVFIGAAVAVLCAGSMRYDQWFVHRTSKGQRLTKAFGEQKAIWIWRVCLLAGIVFGACLSTGLVNPMTWNG